MEDVCVSGAVWSSLVLEHANSKGDSEGFLIGDVSGREVNSISDSSSQHLKYERISTIQGLIPCSNIFSFYDKVGRIDRQKFQDTVGQCQENIIGWYKFRRNSQQLVSMRERHVHHNLIKELRFSPQEFLFIVFTASIEAGLSVHSLNYSIYSSTSLNSSFDNHELKVINLRDTSHSEYRLKPDTIRTPSRAFQEVIDAYREDFIDRDGCMQQPLSTHSMYISLVRNMKDILIDVKNSESTVSVMSEQVDSLREQVETLKNKLLEKRRKLEENQVVTAQLIEIKDSDNKTESTNVERVVEGAEGFHRVLRSKHQKKSNKSRSRQTDKMDTATDTLIDLSDDSSSKKPFSDASLKQLPLNGALVYQSTTKESYLDVSHDDGDDDDETQDFSLPEDKQQQSLLQQQTLMESMSPTF